MGAGSLVDTAAEGDEESRGMVPAAPSMASMSRLMSVSGDDAVDGVERDGDGVETRRRGVGLLRPARSSSMELFEVSLPRGFLLLCGRVGAVDLVFSRRAKRASPCSVSSVSSTVLTAAAALAG